MKKIFAVKTTNRVKPWQHVEAQYFTLDHGHLCFRRSGSGQYPDTVHAFAPGHWLQVKLLKTFDLSSEQV